MTLLHNLDLVCALLSPYLVEQSALQKICLQLFLNLIYQNILLCYFSHLHWKRPLQHSVGAVR